ncbi:hypothetical protein WKK05_10960 [Nostoc sp. UHCC 0302]|uniref:hypothetical protein n=1 Tax=Nostoc sp. UHCC 0302 TaxID=3134896 RepID=UPI00311CAC69
MFPGHIERELFCGEIWSIWQKTKLPEHLELLVHQEKGKCDIWECQSQESEDREKSEQRVRKEWH